MLRLPAGFQNACGCFDVWVFLMDIDFAHRRFINACWWRNRRWSQSTIDGPADGFRLSRGISHRSSSNIFKQRKCLWYERIILRNRRSASIHIFASMWRNVAERNTSFHYIDATFPSFLAPLLCQPIFLYRVSRFFHVTLERRWCCGGNG